MLDLADDRSYANTFTRIADYSTGYEKTGPVELAAEMSVTSALFSEYLSFDFSDTPCIMRLCPLAAL